MIYQQWELMKLPEPVYKEKLINVQKTYYPNMSKEDRIKNIEGWHYAVEGVLAMSEKER